MGIRGRIMESVVLQEIVIIIIGATSGGRRPVSLHPRLPVSSTSYLLHVVHQPYVPECIRPLQRAFQPLNRVSTPALWDGITAPMVYRIVGSVEHQLGQTSPDIPL